jgi:hypothetical protein
MRAAAKEEVSHDIGRERPFATMCVLPKRLGIVLQYPHEEIKAATKWHPERSGGRGLDGEPTGARVRVSRSGGCGGHVRAGQLAATTTRGARCRGRQECGQSLTEGNTSHQLRAVTTMDSVAEGRRAMTVAQWKLPK